MLGGAFLGLNCWRLYKDKLVRGVDWKVIFFFTFWGFWNLYYYPHLEQWLSLVAGAFIAIMNLIYFGMMIYYMRQEKINDRDDTLSG